MTSPSILLKAWGIRPKKSMGQYFLADPNIAASIVKRSNFGPEDTVLEIGAGLGALTIPLAFRTKHVLAVEPDREIAVLLRNELLASGVSNVTIIEKDILECDVDTLVPSTDRRLKVAGNLPYYVSSQVLVHLISFRKSVDRAVFMFQKEVAERLLAEPGTKAYGRLSVMVQYCAEIRPGTRVSPSAFYPKPKVDSKVVEIRFCEPAPFSAADEDVFFRIIRAAFGKRRKMLKNALLNSSLGLEEDRLSVALELASIDPQRRAETLGVQEFVRLANLLTQHKSITYK